MTVQYNRYLLNVQNVKYGLFRLMFMWRGSVYKMIWPELLLFCAIYTIFSFSYHFVMSETQKDSFELIAKYCNEFSRKLPLSFVLGFFADTILTRFWVQFNNIVWPLDISFKVGALVNGNDEEGRMLRRNISRYVCTGFVMALTCASQDMKKRFPTLDHLVNAGFLLEEEKKIIDNLPSSVNKYFVPFNWAAFLVQRASKEQRLTGAHAAITLIDAINGSRGRCGFITSIDDVTVPLAYTQVVITAVLIFCASCLLGRYKFDNGDESDFHIPFMTIFQFIFYMGWLKVSLGGINAFGSDDDDFEFPSLIDALLHECYIVVDTLHDKLPDLKADPLWDDHDSLLPYTLSSLKTMKTIYVGSANEFVVPARQQKIVETPQKRIIVK